MTQPLTTMPDPSPASPARPDDMTLVIPLRAKHSISLPDFYDYWLNAHVTLPPRFPGISSIWLHVVSTDRSVWPTVAGVDSGPALEDEFHGVPEATFPTMADLLLFLEHSQTQMDDGINFLQEQIAYRSLGANTATIVDRLDNPAPDGHDTLIRHLVFLRKRCDLPVEVFRRFFTDALVPALASSPQIRKLRRHLFEEVEVTLDHPGVRASKPLDRQYQAALEVVVADRDALDDLAGSPLWRQVARDLATHCDAVHACRVDRCITTKHDGRITLAGVRGVAVADLIDRLDARSQRQDAVSELFLTATARTAV